MLKATSAMVSKSLQEFDWDAKLVPGRTMLVLGRPHSRALLMSFVIPKMSHLFDLVVSFGKPSKAQENVFKAASNHVTFSELDSRVLQDVVDMVNTQYKAGKKVRVFLYIEDPQVDIFRSKPFRYIMNNGYHGGQFTVLVSMRRYPYYTPTPELRNNIDYTFAFNEPNQAVRKKLYMMFFGLPYSTFEEFDEVHNHVTTIDHGFMVNDNTSSGWDCFYGRVPSPRLTSAL